MSEVAVQPWAKPFSAVGGPHGALVLHGFTGSPQSVRGVAEALADAGFTVELPRLPGHGTSVEDMLTTRWEDWSSAAEAAYVELAARCDRVVVTGLSMGGTLTVWLAAHHPETAGIAVVNPQIEPIDQSVTEMARELIQKGETTIAGIGSDIADPDQVELAYEQTPLVCLLSLASAVEQLTVRLSEIDVPTLILNSPQDHVVPPTSSDKLAGSIGGPVERVSLDRSYHVATLDYDRELVEQRVVEFARRVTHAGTS